MSFHSCLWTCSNERRKCDFGAEAEAALMQIERRNVSTQTRTFQEMDSTSARAWTPEFRIYGFKAREKKIGKRAAWVINTFKNAGCKYLRLLNCPIATNKRHYNLNFWWWVTGWGGGRHCNDIKHMWQPCELHCCIRESKNSWHSRLDSWMRPTRLPTFPLHSSGTKRSCLRLNSNTPYLRGQVWG